MIADVDRVNELRVLLEQDPVARAAAERAVGLEERVCPEGVECWRKGPQSASHRLPYVYHGQGYTYVDLVIHPEEATRLYRRGLLTILYTRSQKANRYELVDVPATRYALELLRTPATPPPSRADEDGPEHGPLPAGLWDGVVGLEEERSLIAWALEAEKPVSMALVGPPASGKTVLAEAILALPGSELAYGGAMTARGLADLLMDRTPPRYLVVDECDKGERGKMGTALSRLLSVLDKQLLTDLRQGSRVERHLDLWGFLLFNDLARVDPGVRDALESRCYPLVMRPLEVEQRHAVIRGFLVGREGVDDDLARLIADEVAPRSADVRRARDIARMSKGHPERIPYLAERLVR